MQCIWKGHIFSFHLVHINGTYGSIEYGQIEFYFLKENYES